MALPGHQGQPFEAKDQDKQAVFEAYGKTFKYAKNSLYLFGQDSPLRRKIVGIVAHPWFDRFVLCVILLNSLVLALTDWSNIDEDPDSADVGEPVAEGSWRNTLLYGSEPAFTAFFSLELVLKVIAQGFYVGRGSYLRDPWNILDFVVVVTALMTNIPGMPQMSAIRVFRVLRPLRSVHQLPGLQKLVLGMLRSVPQLVSVVVLLLFIFTVFGIFGIQIFAGKQHSRCRLTPYPVALSFEVCPLINRPPIPSGVFGMWFLGMALGDAIYTFLLDASEKYRSRTDSSGSVDKKGA